MTDYEGIARLRLVHSMKPAEYSVRQSVRITEKLIFGASLIAVVVVVWLFACFWMSWS